MKRILTIIFTTLSLILLLAVLGLTVRGWFTSDRFSIASDHYYCEIHLNSCTLGVLLIDNRELHLISLGHFSHVMFRTFHWPTLGVRWSATRAEFHPIQGEGQLVHLVIPYWLFAVPAAIWPVRRILKRLRRMPKKEAPLVCLECGYDLRASKDRCPECGTPIGQGGKRSLVKRVVRSRWSKIALTLIGLSIAVCATRTRWDSWDLAWWVIAGRRLPPEVQIPMVATATEDPDAIDSQSFDLLAAKEFQFVFVDRNGREGFDMLEIHPDLTCDHVFFDRMPYPADGIWKHAAFSIDKSVCDDLRRVLMEIRFFSMKKSYRTNTWDGIQRWVIVDAVGKHKYVGWDSYFPKEEEQIYQFLQDRILKTPAAEMAESKRMNEAEIDKFRQRARE